MNTTTVSSSSDPLTQARTPAAAGGPTLGKNDFLKLLITQLRHQDPLNPMDQSQFLSQTAQFTSLEHLQNIAIGLEQLRAVTAGSALTQAATLLGRTATVTGREFVFDGLPTELSFTLAAPAGVVTVDVLDQAGTVLRRLAMGATPAGETGVVWDGSDSQGTPLTTGDYFYRVAATDLGGDPIRAVAAQGTLTGLSTDAGRTLYRIGEMTVRQEDIVELG